jgi:hypothetical protein
MHKFFIDYSEGDTIILKHSSELCIELLGIAEIPSNNEWINHLISLTEQRDL